jgi:hypothetical protein
MPLATPQLGKRYTGGKRTDSIDLHVGQERLQHRLACASAGVCSSLRDVAAREPRSIIVHRSFVFAIRDRKTDVLLFLGRVSDAGNGTKQPLTGRARESMRKP